jgi:putative FmdB family regulatory protein
MPLYEYECQKCEHTFEKLVSNGDAVKCPECASKQLRRLLSVPAKPRTQSSTLPTACNSDGPPCGPHCSRFGE